jgi:hypothetical protein
MGEEFREQMPWLFTADDVDRIVEAGSFSSPLQPLVPFSGLLPPHIDNGRAEFAAWLEKVGGTYIMTVETTKTRRLERELNKLLSGTARLRRTIVGHELVSFLGPSYRRADLSGAPKAPHDESYLDLLSKLIRADAALAQLDKCAHDLKARLKPKTSAQVLVILLADMWKNWKGRWPGVSVDPKSGRVHGPFIRFVHEVVKSLRAESPNLPMPAAASIRVIIRDLRREMSPMSNPAKKRARRAI